MVKVTGLPEDERINSFVDVVKNNPTCVTLIVFVILLPVMVMVAVRYDADVWAAAVTVTALLFEPDDGETVSQEDALLFTFTVQLSLEVMLNDFCSPDTEKLMTEVTTVRNGAAAACDTLIVCVISFPLTLIVAVRCVIVGLAVALTVMSPSFEPEDGETVNQEVSLLLVVQFMFEATVNVS